MEEGGSATMVSDRGRSRALLVAALMLFALNVALRFPGTLSFDAAKQYEQAVSGRFTDWHPPIMAVVWSWLRPLGGAAPSMLALQLIGHWAGFGLLADGLARTGRRRAAWITLLSGASPLFLFYNGVIYKDVVLASALLAAFGAVFWFRVQGRPVSLPALLFALVCIAFATLVRSNAVFAFGPVLLFALVPPRRLTTGRLTALSLALAIVAVPVSGFINHRLLNAAPSGVTQTLQLFDLAGIAHQSGDLSVLPAGTRMTRGELDNCYTPLYWDPLAMKVCNEAFLHLPPPGSPQRDAIGTLWLSAILKHPVSYAEHRLKAFNALLNFFVPAQQCRFAPFDASCGTPDPHTGRMIETSDSARFIRWDYVKKNPVVWPCTWLALGIGLAAMFWSQPRSPVVAGARILLASALLYALAYLVVGVAADIRYFYWPIVAIQTAALVDAPGLYGRIRARDPVALAAIVLVIAVIALGYVARLTDNQSFVMP